MAYNLTDKSALVTGAASGIGRATARRLATAGANVAVVDVDVEGGEETIEMIEEEGGTAEFIETDVSRGEEVEAMVETVVDTFGSLDAAHNNAGIEGDNEATVEQTEENWNRVIDTNLKGVWLCMKHEIPAMLNGNGGAIVNTSSISGQTGAGAAPYVASKHGILGLTRTAAVEQAQNGVRVNAICPGTVDTPVAERYREKSPEEFEQFVQMHPMGRIGEPMEIAHAVTWLLSEEASFATGDMFQVDGGFMAL
jgi:NAD(P)-dependent dehydrogenase (short-subunit alcohol dehydrogenase family)